MSLITSGGGGGVTLLDIYRPLVKSAYHKKYIFLDQSICFGYSEEPSQ